MAEQKTKDIRLHDPLSEVTRKERTMLLGISMLGLVIVKVGIVPTKIAALGVEFDKANQLALLGIIAMITLYFLVAFLIYAAADFLAWRGAMIERQLDRMREHLKLQRELTVEQLREEEKIMGYNPYQNTVYVLVGPVSVSRTLFEFLLPVVVGLYTLFLLLISPGLK